MMMVAHIAIQFHLYLSTHHHTEPLTLSELLSLFLCLCFQVQWPQQVGLMAGVLPHSR